MKKSLMSLAVAGFAILSLTSCGGTTASTAAGPTGMTMVISGPAEHETFIIRKLNELKAVDTDFANVTFSYTVIGENEIDSKVPNYSADTAPDVYAMASDKTLVLLQQGAIAQVPSTYRNNITSTMNDDAVDIASVASTVYSYPYASDNGYFLYYNKTIFTGENADKYKKIEDLFAVAQEKNMKVGYPLNEAYYSIGALFTFGADYEVTVGNQNTITAISADFDSDKGVNAVKALASMIQNPNRIGTQGAPTAQTGGTLAVIDGAWNYSAHAAALGDDLGLATMPTVTVDTGGDPAQVTSNIGAFLGYKCYGVNPLKAQGNNARLALSHKIANYLISKDVQLDRFNTLHVTPTNEELLDTAAIKEDPLVKVILDQRELSHTQGVVPGGIWNSPSALYNACQPDAPEEDKYTVAKAQEFATKINNAIKAIS